MVSSTKFHLGGELDRLLLNSEHSEECISFTMCVLLFIFSMNNYSSKNSATIFKCKPFSENILDLVSTLGIY